jgi:outer membrane protein assembly factor BamA
MKRIFIITLIFSLSLSVAQEESKTGWSFGALPAIAYDSDAGWTYGALGNIYNYGDGAYYPDYLYSIYAEISRTTKGGGINKLFFDSKYLLPADIRITSELSLLTESTLPFYGFNGYEAQYNPSYEISDTTDENYDANLYRTRVYYRHRRDMTKFTADFLKNMGDMPIKGVVGLSYINVDVGPVNIEDINKGNTEDLLPDSVNTLYDNYVVYGLISSDEMDGGKANYLKFGLVYDTRDQEANPMKGMWTEILLMAYPSFLGNESAYTLATMTHRQYFTMKKDILSIATRFAVQQVISGNIPFYNMPYLQSSFKPQEGLGGSKTVRGLLKNRVVGDGFALFNLEARWKFLRTKVAGQNLYLAFNGFVDGGYVYDNHPYDNASYYHIYSDGSEMEKEALHLSYGGGFRVALNQNFIVAADMGFAKDERDGNSGLYIGLGYLF